MHISSFKELMNEIGYSWEYPNYDLEKHEDGTYSLNKLYICSEFVQYKTERWTLSTKAFEDLENFYEFLKKLEN